MKLSILFITVITFGILSALPTAQKHDKILKSYQQKNWVDDIIISALDAVRGILQNGIPSANIPPLDPFNINHLLVNLNSSLAVLGCQLDNVAVTHLSEFIVESVNSNLIQLKMNMELREPIFRIDGHYAIDGTIVSLLPLYGSGNFYISVTNATIGGGAGLSLTPPSIKNLYLDFTFESIEVHFENLLGGGSMETIVETVINDLGKNVVDSVWPIISGPLCDIIENAINNALSNSNSTASFSHVKTVGNANYYLDDVLTNLRTILYNSGIDPTTLPDAYTDFSGGHVGLYNGWLMGYSGIHRSGDATLEFVDNVITFIGNAGFTNLQAGYKCQVQVWGVDVDAEAWAVIRSVDFLFSFAIDRTSSEVIVNDFKLAFGTIDIEISGLTPFDWVFDSIANLAIDSMKNSIADTISNVILELLKQAISSNPPTQPMELIH